MTTKVEKGLITIPCRVFGILVSRDLIPFGIDIRDGCSGVSGDPGDFGAKNRIEIGIKVDGLFDLGNFDDGVFFREYNAGVKENEDEEALGIHGAD